MELKLNFYENYPEGEVKYFEMLEIAEERLKFYQILQNIELTSEYKQYTDNWYNLINELIIKYDFKNFEILLLSNAENEIIEKIAKAYKADSIGHWILKIAYSKTHTLQKFFLKNETIIFNLKLRKLDNEKVIKLIKNYNKDIRELTEEEKELFKNSLNYLANDMENISHYKTQFSNVTTLLITRKYLLKDGFLYIPSNKLKYFLLERFKYNLKETLIYTSKCLKNRLNICLKSLLDNLTLIEPIHVHIRSDKDEKITLEELDTQAKLNYPICMRYMHEIFREEHHLKYFGRMQYGLFLKGLGLTLDESLKFWSNEFQKKMSEKEFLKKYSYYIKHQYGKVGSKINYLPYNCNFIIEQNYVHSTQHYGCPFKHWENEKLISKLEEYGINNLNDIEDIMQLKSKECYNQACTKFFQCQTGFAPDQLITNPNQYFNNSYRLSQLFSRNIDIFSSDED